MNSCESLNCTFWNGNRCTDERKFVNEYGDELGFDNYGDAFEDALKTSLKMITHDNQ